MNPVTYPKKNALHGSLFCIASIVIAGCAPSIRYTRDQAPVGNDIRQEYSTGKASEIRVDEKSIADVPEDRLKSVIASCIGVPYRRAGISRSGFDCSGFVCLVFREAFNITLPRSSREMQRCGTKISLSSAAEGDLVFFRNYRIGRTGHVGIYMGDGRFVHASVKRGVIYSNINGSYFKSRFTMARRILE